MDYDCLLDDEDVGLSPLEITEHATTSMDMLPETSRQKYETAYKRFMEWRVNKDAASFSENVTMAYFQELSKNYKASTLWATYSMLRSTVAARHSIDFARYPKLRAFLKKQAHGYIAKKSKTLTTENINLFLRKAPDDKYLLVKVALIIGTTGACRREELCKLDLKNMEDLGSALLVKIPDTKTRSPRTFVITDKFFEIYKKYASLRPPNTMHTRFFLNFHNGRCTKQPLGINKFGRMARQVASYLRLPNPELYTGHCFRRSSANISADTDYAEGSSAPSSSRLPDPSPVQSKTASFQRHVEDMYIKTEPEEVQPDHEQSHSHSAEDTEMHFEETKDTKLMEALSASACPTGDQKKDDIDILFLGYAAMVKKFSPRRQIQVKFKIAQLLFEEELQQQEEDSRRTEEN